MLSSVLRKSRLAYVAVCLELNIAAQGTDLADVEKKLRDAIETYCDEVKNYPETFVSSMSTEDLIEFLQDTEPDWYVAPSEKMMLSPKALKNQLFCHIWGEKLSLSTGLNLRYFFPHCLRIVNILHAPRLQFGAQWRLALAA